MGSTTNVGVPNIGVENVGVDKRRSPKRRSGTNAGMGQTSESRTSKNFFFQFLIFFIQPPFPLRTLSYFSRFVNRIKLRKMEDWLVLHLSEILWTIYSRTLSYFFRFVYRGKWRFGDLMNMNAPELLLKFVLDYGSKGNKYQKGREGSLGCSLH